MAARCESTLIRCRAPHVVTRSNQRRHFAPVLAERLGWVTRDVTLVERSETELGMIGTGSGEGGSGRKE
jgi:hypothetical protein